MGQFTRDIPNPMVPDASLALNMVIPIIAGYFGGSLTGGLVGLLGTLFNFLIKYFLYPLSGPDWYELVAVIPHALMGMAAGAPLLRQTRIGTASTVIIGHGLNILGFLLADLLDVETIREPIFWAGLLTETVVNIIIAAFVISLVRYVQGEGPGFAWSRMGWRRFLILSVLNLLFLALLVIGCLNEIPLASQLFILPVVFATLTLGFLETWLIVVFLSLLLGYEILQLGLPASAQEVSFILSLNLVALSVGELAGNLQEQRYLARMRLEELQQAYTVLSEIDSLKDQMIQNISHELRTPLSMILGYTELLSAETWGALTPEQREAAGVIGRNARNLSHIVEKVTVLDDVRLGEITQHPVSLDALAQMEVNAKARWASVHNCALNLKVVDTTPPLLGDARRIGQAIEALIENAVKFSPDGGPVTIRVWVEGERAYLSVEDHGIGIAEEDQKLLFQRFYQVDGSTTRRYGGVGAGLALVKEVVRAHGGDVWVESTPGKGSTFGFWLPLTTLVRSHAPVFV
ncbi:MAG: sensor histidine kinase [Anaerolineae bacterium]